MQERLSAKRRICSGDPNRSTSKGGAPRLNGALRWIQSFLMGWAMVIVIAAAGVLVFIFLAASLIRRQRRRAGSDGVSTAYRSPIPRETPEPPTNIVGPPP